MKPKVTLAMIVKPTDGEAMLLDRCLKVIHKQFDEICITQAGKKKNKKVSEIVDKYKGKESFFKWVNDFAKARNFNFSQATGKYIFWCDADDLVRGADKIPSLVEKMEKEKIDGIVMNYKYDFDEYGKCTVQHLKTRIVRKDSVVWVGAVHEDFEQTRVIETYFTPTVEILHITDEERYTENAERNMEIAKEEMKSKPNDPRCLWLMANAHWGLQEIGKAVKYFKKFVKESHSQEEIYLAYLNMAAMTGLEDHALKAISCRPTYPNAYFKIAELKYKRQEYDIAIQFIEIGLQLPKPELSIIVFNPRDYDYNPLVLLMDCHFQLGNYTKALQTLDHLIESFPNDENLKARRKLVDDEVKDLGKVDEILEKAVEMKLPEMKKFLESQSEEVQSHPKFCTFKNNHFVKKRSSGKDLVYYCGYTSKIWNPDVAEKDGVGGSEEAVINLSKRWAKLGWNVTVYNNCGKRKDFDGVKYRPYWEFNARDKQDILILWRHPKPCDWRLNADKVFIDLHDVIPKEEFLPERMEQIDKVFVKTKAHRELYPNIPDEKVVIIPNGVDPSQFEDTVEKNPYLILNTSSPDRHLDATLDTFEELIKTSTKPWKLAWYYGWEVYEGVHAEDKEMMEWMETQKARFNKLVKEGRAEGGGMVSSGKIAEKYLEAGVFLYPTQFFEIHCISAVKAQLAKCKMVTSDFAALKETVNKAHHKIHTDGEKWGKENTLGDNQTKLYVDAIRDRTNYVDTSEWAKEKYNWDKISNNWNEVLCKK